MNNPFKITEPTVISFSGGRTSAYMLWRVLEANNGLPDDGIVCFANTGKEQEETLKFVRDCEVNWGIHIVWLEYVPDKPRFAVVDYQTASRGGEPFESLITKKNYLPNAFQRFCTQELKVLTIDRYMKSIEKNEYLTMVGIRKDEERRAARLSEDKYSPLVAANICQSDVQSFGSSQNFDLNLKFANGVTHLGNCDLCFLKGGNQISSLIQDNPERAIWWANMEKKIGSTFRKDRPSYSQLIKLSTDQMPLFGDETIGCFCGD